ncbi:MAG: MBL fold metallo-hydrolase [Verrucomicrobia bacterium]|nr:MAG: MBL fold metallo-hydrolase [Verrucomicrobiota bacterium]
MLARFKNPWPTHMPGLKDVLRWKLGFGDKIVPQFPLAHDPAPWLALTKEQLHDMPPRGWRVTWLGHAAFLLSGCGVHLLIDPIFSEYCGPLRCLGLRRKVPTPCHLDELPPITAVLLTHTHYDHCDLPTLRALGKDTPLIVPEGHSAWFARAGFASARSLAWWQSVDMVPGISVTATPAQHFTARGLADRNRGHWCGWCVAGGGVKLWHSGDSGYCPAFREIGARLGPLDFGMIGIGAYQPNWFMRSLHMTPGEALLAFQDSGCRHAVAMHWGTFQLSDEPLGEPPLLLARELSERGVAPERFQAGGVGQQWSIVECGGLPPPGQASLLAGAGMPPELLGQAL